MKLIYSEQDYTQFHHHWCLFRYHNHPTNGLAQLATCTNSYLGGQEVKTCQKLGFDYSPRYWGFFFVGLFCPHYGATSGVGLVVGLGLVVALVICPGLSHS